jgi:hypothetical protein
LPWASNKELSQGIKDINYKALPLKALKEFIEELFEAKVHQDRRSSEAKEPRETMEQFMYFHLKQKYGLSSLVVEWVFALIDGVRLYSDKDATVALFGLVS